MMAINKALDEVRFNIPPEVLDVVFLEQERRWRKTPVSLDEVILHTVIRPRVLVDCRLLGGTEAFIYLDGVPFTRTDDYTSVYHIPKRLTQGRTITSVKNITFTDPTKVSSYGIAAGQQNTQMMQVGSAVMDAHGSIPVTSTARVQLIGENVIMVRDTVVLPANIYLRCMLEDDENMNHIQLKSYRAFAKLVVLAVKHYIYNFYIVPMDIGALHGGQALGRIKEIIDGYSEAGDQYQEFLTEKWEKIAVMNDMESWGRMIRLMIGGSR
jgi:hypothetical protein